VGGGADAQIERMGTLVQCGASDAAGWGGAGLIMACFAGWHAQLGALVAVPGHAPRPALHSNHRSIGRRCQNRPDRSPAPPPLPLLLTGHRRPHLRHPADQVVRSGGARHLLVRGVTGRAASALGQLLTEWHMHRRGMWNFAHNLGGFAAPVIVSRPSTARAALHGGVRMHAPHCLLVCACLAQHAGFIHAGHGGTPPRGASRGWCGAARGH
jgi:hypothetical protein